MKEQLAALLSAASQGDLSVQEVMTLLEKPKHEHLGDIAFPCFSLAKKYKKAPTLIATELAQHIQADFIQEVRVEGAYINFYLQQLPIAQQIVTQILAEQQKYGSRAINNETIALDFSSPNIAKPFSMGHLRSTVIGHALANIAEKMGYQTERINHLGDWGTQFGKLIVAYKLWGNKAAIEANPIEELLKIYVRFHQEAEQNEALNEQARQAFKALEDGDAKTHALWRWFREASLKEFQSIYELLGVAFDSYNGEAFYNDKMASVVVELEAKQLLIESDGAMVVSLEDMPPCLITKNDGATLYATRDLAAAIYRQETYKPAKVFYVVGNEQSLHFKQLFTVLKKMGHQWAENYQHIPFGMMLVAGKKMSTRKGKVVLLADVLKEAMDAALHNIEEKNPTLANKEQVAKQVGIGAVIFNDLKNDRMHDIDFDIEHMVTFEGETGPYVQYTYARIQTLLKKGAYIAQQPTLGYLDETAWPLIKQLQDFPAYLEKAFNDADPSQIAKYSLLLARNFNKYYAQTKLLSGDDLQQARLAVVDCVAIVLRESLRLLGIESPEEM
ncbi:arginine--tRNA ligase [Metasolibacillus sp. FSL H7-0170]|uniref:arginine--tRNA ligase n=1 Tax=Metasolibacillus TaxID=2703677 RepID=UPI000D3B46A7|nr:arginine--tRNA ligase [Metasolibacillus fluoroglycofenilyticus]